jgi:hypothetical protein
MSVKKPDPISVNTIRNLNDKLYDKRKLGALEVEQQVKELNKQQEHDKILELILYLQESFVKSTSVSSRKGGLIALAAVALGLGQVRLFLYSQWCTNLCRRERTATGAVIPPSPAAMMYFSTGCAQMYSPASTTGNPVLQ